MSTITITTKKGALVELTMAASGTVSGKVLNTSFDFWQVETTVDRDHGLCIKFGKSLAPVCDADILAVKDFFAAATKVKAEWGQQAAAEYRNSAEGFSDRMNARMNGRNSDH